MTTFRFSKITPHPNLQVLVLAVMMIVIYPLLDPVFEKIPFTFQPADLGYVLLVPLPFAVFFVLKWFLGVFFKATSSLVINNDTLKLIKGGLVKFNLKLSSITAVDPTQPHSRPVFLDFGRYGVTLYHFGFTIFTSEGAYEVFGELENFEEFKALLKQLNPLIQESEVSNQRITDQRSMDMAEYAKKYRPNSGLATWFMKQSLPVAVIFVVGSIIALIGLLVLARELTR